MMGCNASVRRRTGTGKFPLPLLPAGDDYVSAARGNKIMALRQGIAGAMTLLDYYGDRTHFSGLLSAGVAFLLCVVRTAREVCK
jgi:hypothetical protein